MKVRDLTCFRDLREDLVRGTVVSSFGGFWLLVFFFLFLVGGKGRGGRGGRMGIWAFLFIFDLDFLFLALRGF